jgi:hypothetical protein
MVTVDNFASKLCSIILEKNVGDEANEWRLLGQEQDGTLLFSWIQSSKTQKPVTNIGLYSFPTNDLTIIHSFGSTVNCIQASIDSSKTFLIYVVKEVDPENNTIFGGSPRVRPFHCTEVGLTSAIIPNADNSGAQFLVVGTACALSRASCYA